MQCLTISECEAWRTAHSRRREWKRQMTARTPLDRLPWFRAALVERLTPFDRALLVIDLSEKAVYPRATSQAWADLFVVRGSRRWS